MEQKKKDCLRQAYQLLFQVSGVPVCIADYKETLICCPEMEEPVYAGKLMEACISEFKLKKRDIDHPLFLTLIPECYLGIAQLDDEDVFLLIGPAIGFSPSRMETERLLDLPVFAANRTALDFLLRRMEPVSTREFLHAFSLGIYLYNQRMVNVEKLRIETPLGDAFSVGSTYAEYVFESRETLRFHTPESYERGLMEAIEEGDLEKMRHKLMQPTLGRIGMLSKNQTRNWQYLFVTGAAISARAAMRGGLNYETACNMADCYCQEMDTLKTESQANDLYVKMFADFCEQVSLSKKAQRRTPLSNACCDYIYKHLHEKISLDDLARHCGFSPRYLSRLFQQEMGVSLPDYIQSMKVKEAEQLLICTNATISEISTFLGFSSQSYFSFLFKKANHISPQQFRKTQHTK